MKTAEDLKRMLRDRDGRGYPAYKDVRGRYRFNDFVLSVDHVQGDPFAAPSKVSAFVALEQAGFTGEWLGRDVGDARVAHEESDQNEEASVSAGVSQEPVVCNRRRALEDYLVRRLSRELGKRSFRVGGSGKSGLLATSRPGQEILERTACEITSAGVIMRFEVGLPAHGRRIDGRAAERLLVTLVPEAVRAVLLFSDYAPQDAEAARKAIELADDQRFVRSELERKGLVAFVADGSVLPRESGASDKPMRDARPFASPESLRVTLDLPHRGPTPGMGVQHGVTLIVGGGYHGKSTLLQALQAGVYDHVAGDGRELVITDATACKLRAEDGRPVHQVDVSAFIGDLPTGADTHRFSTEDASGSTSQAASLVEDVEAGCRCLLVDEDTSATNFMVRDALMEQVVQRESEPITPFVERVRDLWEKKGVSSVIVAGSSGAYFYVADTVIQMKSYQAFEITDRVHRVLSERARAGEPGVVPAPGFALPRADRKPWGKAGARSATREANVSRAEHGGQDGRHQDGRHGARGGTQRKHGNGRGHGRGLKVRTQGRESLQVGGVSCDLRAVEQVADAEQVAALAQMVRYCLERSLLSDRTPAQVVAVLRTQITRGGLSAVGASAATCGLALPREQEIFACLNRLRGVQA